MPCRHVRVGGKRFRVVSIKKTRKLPKGSKILIPSPSGKKKKAYHTRRKKQKHSGPWDWFIK